MRHSDQLPLSAPWIGQVHAAELAAISALLDQQPRIMALVEQDLRTRCPKNPPPAAGASPATKCSGWRWPGR